MKTVESSICFLCGLPGATKFDTHDRWLHDGGCLVNTHVIYETKPHKKDDPCALVDVIEITVHGHYTRRLICTCPNILQADRVAGAMRVAGLMHELHTVIAAQIKEGV